ncbi:REP-associated tyrosine transposase [Stenotrophomonas nitritireducens]|uniref:REP-associated tyrosine transposase n=1 Tax=Stenotrophomonas nitritireducens TaxID=83617 RepID=UPI003D977F3B
MPSPELRKGRHSMQGAVYAVTVNTRHRQALFRDASMAEVVREQLRYSDNEGSSQTHAWVVMPDHLHWLFTLDQGELSACLRRFKSRSARAINQVRRQSGAIWQPGFYNHRLRDDEDLRGQARYIVANPVRAGLVADVHEYPHWGCQWISRHVGIDGS